MSGQRRRSDAHSSILHPRADHAPHVASHLGADVVIRVIKIGGRAQADPSLPSRLKQAADAAGTRLVIVHGGGDEVSGLQRSMGVEPRFVNGRRMTSVADLEAVRMVLSGTVNKRLVAQLITAGVRAVGVSGEDGALLVARVTDAAFGRVGGDVLADATLVADLLNAGWVPVISPLARDGGSSEGAGLNVNGDDAAAAIAASLGADELLFLVDVPGVLEDGVTVDGLDPAGIEGLIARGTVQGGMRAKLEAATSALRNGVRRVRIAALEGVTDTSTGTAVTLSPNSRKDPA